MNFNDNLNQTLQANLNETLQAVLPAVKSYKKKEIKN